MTKSETEIWELPIGKYVSIKAIIHKNPLELNQDDLFSLGFRYNNSKRSFMFVSKVLGKHSAINPIVLRDMSKNLAHQYYSNINTDIHTDKKTLVIGFAEAATAMAQCFADAISGDVSYVHSTRETPEGIDPLFTFKEVHSHAPCHNFYLKDEKLITEAEEIILVDDELTSGRTALGVIKTINALYPGKEFGLAAYLDWREPKDKEAFNKLREEGVVIKCRSLLHGHIDLDKVVIPKEKTMPIYKEKKEYTSLNWKKYNLDFPTMLGLKTSYLQNTGRFGLSPEDNIELKYKIHESANIIRKWLPPGKSLFLGTGEFLYIPLKIAEYIGNSVSFQSVTRTPNLPLKEENYEIREVDVFPSVMDPSRNEFLYNLEPDNFDNIVLFLERGWSEERLKPMLSIIENRAFKSYSMVVLSD